MVKSYRHLLGLAIELTNILFFPSIAKAVVHMILQLSRDRDRLEFAACETSECFNHVIVVVKLAMSKHVHFGYGERYVLKMGTADVSKLETGAVIDTTRNVSWRMMEGKPTAAGERVDLMEEVP